jgi:peptidoglycan/xylan/chitin deacetylase (PgdA/CDA1 family)
MTVVHCRTRWTYDVQRAGEGTREVNEVGTFGPGGLPRALVLTFDNLGEASELERGSWSPDTPLGRHPSVTRALPRLLDELDAHGLTATFFVEAINCEGNPQALHEIAARGHELGIHGWRHEPWAQLPADRERELLTRSGQAFRDLGLAARGFRPPGGELTERSEALLRDLGYDWCSPLGRAPASREDLAFVPFGWELVDAYHLMERFGELRERRGDRAAPLTADELADRFATALTGGAAFQTLILHPFLMLDEAWFAGVRRLLALIEELSVTGRTWVVPGGRFADWLRGATRSMVRDQ